MLAAPASEKGARKELAIFVFVEPRAFNVEELEPGKVREGERFSKPSKPKPAAEPISAAACDHDALDDILDGGATTLPGGGLTRY